VEDVMAESVLGEMFVKREDRVQMVRVNQRKGCAIGEAEIFVCMPYENPFRGFLDWLGNAEKADR
jgi:hypothetical protein